MIKITPELISFVSEQAKSRPRLRQNYNFHKHPEDPLQRLLNAIEPYSYLQPHKHENPDKREIFFVLKGRVLVLEYDDTGNIIDHIILDPLKGNFFVEIPERTWHSVISLESGTVTYEFKDGPYNPIDDKNFASWAPKEGEPGTREFIQSVLNRLDIPLP